MRVFENNALQSEDHFNVARRMHFMVRRIFDEDFVVLGPGGFGSHGVCFYSYSLKSRMFVSMKVSVADFAEVRVCSL